MYLVSWKMEEFGGYGTNRDIASMRPVVRLKTTIGLTRDGRGTCDLGLKIK